MSRRPNPAADRAEQNRQTLKSLVKIEGNKSCADCKRNKRAYIVPSREVRFAYTKDRPSMGQLEPRHLRVHSVRRSPSPLLWHALTFSRCSGIHRGMGTHISKVKSVDLDSWTDEQLQSVLKWGNARANKSVCPRREWGSINKNRYWEAKLAPGHVPSEAYVPCFRLLSLHSF
jgi:stromal membrane-associated protein